jgi:hypothetical protein
MCWRGRCCRRSGLVIPYFLIFSRFSLLNTYSGLIVVYVSLSLPFAIWLMVSYFEEIPREMEEAALIHRAIRLKALWHVTCRRRDRDGGRPGQKCARRESTANRTVSPSAKRRFGISRAFRSLAPTLRSMIMCHRAIRPVRGCRDAVLGKADPPDGSRR